MTAISLSAGKALQKANMYQNESHRHVSKMKKARLMAALECTAVAERRVKANWQGSFILMSTKILKYVWAILGLCSEARRVGSGRDSEHRQYDQPG